MINRIEDQKLVTEISILMFIVVVSRLALINPEFLQSLFVETINKNCTKIIFHDFKG